MATDSPTAPRFGRARPIDELVVPIGGNEFDGGAPRGGHRRSLPVAAALARGWDLPVRLVHVTDSISSDDPALAAAAADARRRWPGLDIEALHVQGDDAAIAVAGEVGAGALPVVATDHADGWSFKDSVAEALVGRVGEPVILLGPRAGRPDGHPTGHPDGAVVVALDGSPVAEAALEAAASLAGALGRNLWLVRIVADDPPGPSVNGAGGPNDGDAVDEPSGDGERHPELHPEVGLALQRLVDGIDPAVGARWEVVHSNDPVAAIEGFADRVGAGFLVAGTRGRTDESRTTMCSISMGLVAAAARPVLVVHGSEPNQ